MTSTVLLSKGSSKASLATSALMDAAIEGVFDIFQVFKIAGIGKSVKIHNVVIRIFVDEQSYNRFLPHGF